MTINPNIENFNITFDGFTPEAQEAFLFAIDILDNILDPNFITQPIDLQANFTNLGGSGFDENTLGEGSPSFFIGNDFLDFIPDEDIRDFFLPNVLHPEALVIQFLELDGEPFDPIEGPEITITLNSARDDWFFGTNPNNIGQDQIDFITVTLHELIHGLAFVGGFDVNNGIGSFELGSPLIYDSFLANGNGELIANNNLFPNNSIALGNELTSENLFFIGENALAANNGNPVRIYAPPIFELGSSISHLDEDTFNGTIEALETPRITTGEVNREIGPITLGILQDIGWEFLLEEEISEDNPEEITSMNIDIDGNGEADALTDGLLIVRFLFGFTGDSLINDVIGDNATRNTVTEIEGFLEDINPTLDIDGNGEVDALTDGLLVVRFLFGFTGDSLTNDVIGENATRNTFGEVENFLESLLPTTETTNL